MPVVATIWLVTLGTAVGMALLDALLSATLYADESVSKFAKKVCEWVFIQWVALVLMAAILSAILTPPAS